MGRIAGAVSSARPDSDLVAAMIRAIGADPRVATVPGGALARAQGALFAEAPGWAVLLDGTIFNPEDFPAEGDAPDDAARLLASIRRNGFMATLAAVNGDFALAAWDSVDKVLWLARDRFGVRPLYYVESEDRLAFASRTRGLFSLPGFRPTPRSDYVALMAAGHYRFFDNRVECSPFDGIAQLPAAHCLRWSPGQAARVERYYLPPGERDRLDPLDTLAEEYRELLIDAVRRRLARASRPAFTLSGGLDSSSVVSCAHRLSGRPAAAFSTTYADATYDETAEIRDIIDADLAHWHPVPIESPDMFGLLAEMSGFHDEPVATVTWLTHHLLCREVTAAGHDCLFGGLGGDEHHAGEYDYFFYFFADLLASGEEARYRHEVEWWIKHHDHPVFIKTPGVAEAKRKILTDPSVRGRCLPDRSVQLRYAHVLEPGFFSLDAFVPTLDSFFSDYLKNHTYDELTRGTMPCCLRASERNTAAAGLGDFLPFFDHRLTDLAFQVPSVMKIRDGATKQLLRAAMKGLLPEATRTRVKKTGWNAPAHVWFAGRHRDPVMDIIRSRKFRERGIYRAAEVEAIASNHFAVVDGGEAKENHMMFLWQLCALELWLENVDRTQEEMVQ
jgi:asparagine synthase (glutamine-hydrolysing)